MRPAESVRRFVRSIPEKRIYGRGKLDARQRLHALFDPDSFREIAKLVGTASDIPAEGFICGSGKINGRTVFAGAEDFTVLGGSIGTGGTAKRFRIAELAMQQRAPLVMILEGAGHRLSETDGMGRAPNDLLALADLSGQVPMVCIVLGPSAGHGLRGPRITSSGTTRALCPLRADTSATSLNTRAAPSPSVMQATSTRDRSKTSSR